MCDGDKLNITHLISHHTYSALCAFHIIISTFFLYTVYLQLKAPPQWLSGRASAL